MKRCHILTNFPVLGNLTHMFPPPPKKWHIMGLIECQEEGESKSDSGWQWLWYSSWWIIYWSSVKKRRRGRESDSDWRWKAESKVAWCVPTQINGGRQKPCHAFLHKTRRPLWHLHTMHPCLAPTLLFIVLPFQVLPCLLWHREWAKLWLPECWEPSFRRKYVYQIIAQGRIHKPCSGGGEGA